jgi:hypothetical protein
MHCSLLLLGAFKRLFLMTDPLHLGILFSIQKHCSFCLGLQQADKCEEEGERNLLCKQEFVLESLDLNSHSFQIIASVESTQ